MTHNEFVNGVVARLKVLEKIETDDVSNILFMLLHNVTLVEDTTDLVNVDPNDHRAMILRRFVACKMVEGCTPKTLRCYEQTIQKMLRDIPKQVEQITTDDIRYWMAVRIKRDGLSKCSSDNDRRILNSFFSWAEENDVVSKSPTRKIKKVKQEKKVKKPFSDVEVEKLRIGCQGDVRLKAIVELLLSTGMRVGELVLLNRDGIEGDEAVVYGKGEKERVVYLNARSRVALQMYEDTRDDENPALFVSEQEPHKRLGISAVEKDVRDLGARVGINDVHPHRFRRTAATMALERGMPIDQVQQMLGHEQIATTLIYAKSSRESLKQAHKKLMG